MKFLPKVLLLSFVVALTFSFTAIAVPGSRVNVRTTQPVASSLLGTWSLDTSRMPLPPGQRPRSVRFTFGDAGDNRWTTHVDIIYAAGNEVHSVSTAALDGTLSAVKDSPEANSAALKLPAPNVLVMALQKDGILVSTRIYSAMPDGQTLVETAVYPGNNGLPVMRTNYFTRVR